MRGVRETSTALDGSRALFGPGVVDPAQTKPEPATKAASSGGVAMTKPVRKEPACEPAGKHKGGGNKQESGHDAIRCST